MPEIKFLLAQEYDPEKHDPTGWWVSEKLDGVRAWWNGKQFISRRGNAFMAPDWFLERMPLVPLDGELWGGRGRFNWASGVCRSQQKDDRWKKIKYMVFDAPAAQGHFEARMMFAMHYISQSHAKPIGKSILDWTMQGKVASRDDLTKRLTAIEKLGAEGLMIRKPNSKYEGKRSSTLLKVKTWKTGEAIITGYQPGEGKHFGRLGALEVELQDGTEFKVGTGFSDKERDAPSKAGIKIGATITFAYFELSEAGVPRFPSYVGIPADRAIKR